MELLKEKSEGWIQFSSGYKKVKRHAKKTKMQKLVSRHSNRTYRIEEDLPGVGFKVYVFDEYGRITHDYLQDDLDMAKGCARDEFGVPLDSWTPTLEVMCCFCGDCLYYDTAFQLAISKTTEPEEIQGAYSHSICLDKVLHKNFVRHPDI